MKSQTDTWQWYWILQYIIG